MIRTIISDGWRMTEIAPENVPAHNHLPWVNATVPGHAHRDLQDAGIISDPFYRMQERDVSWVDDSDWVYETDFHVETLQTANTYLVFGGLDTIAEIELNGEELGKTDNMFIAHEFYVGNRLRVGHGLNGQNTLRVTFRSARRVGRERQAAWRIADGGDTMPSHWDFWDSRAFVRKAQYMFGWDWGPVLISAGIWKPVELVQIPTARILDYRYDVAFQDDGSALVTVEAFVERAPDAVDAPLALTISLGDGALPASVTVPEGYGRIGASATISIPHARRWQPNGVGEAALYPLSLTLTANRQSVDWLNGRIGLRTVELLHEMDADGLGQGFKFRVNGSDIFIKGANWIPTYSFPSHEKIGDQIRDAAEAGFNMLRIWGGGLYESEEFYRLCDEHGIMVWQDFAYACSYYPDSGEYAEASRTEAVAAVRRLRAHASLVIWCGNNENDTMYDTDWGNLKPSRYHGHNLYHEILPSVISEEDPGRAYWPSSPFGGEHPASDDFGDQHNWDVWHGRGDWTNYAVSRARFVSEFGFAASCGLAAWNSCLADEDRSARSTAVRWHDKTRKGYDTYLGLIALHFPMPETLNDLVYYSQLNQAEALKFGIEHYRRNKGRCWGTLFWQLNDCWPVQSWSVIDSAGEWKAAFFASRKFYAPVLVSLVRSGNEALAYIVNDQLSAVEGTLSFTVEDFDGNVLSRMTQPVSVVANGAAQVAVISLDASAGRERQTYIYASLDSSPGRVDFGVPDNLLLLAEPKDLAESGAPIVTSITDHSASHLKVTLMSPRFAPYVWLRSRGETLRLSDNFFHMRAHQTYEVLVRKDDDLDTANDLSDRLVVSALDARIEQADDVELSSVVTA